MKKFGIVTAMEPEAKIIIDFLGLGLSKSYENIRIYEKDGYVLAYTGMGKVQASIGSSIICGEYGIDCLINIGVAGNLNGNNVKIGDVFLIKEIIQHDMYLPLPGDLNYAKGTIKISFQSGLNPDDFNFGFHENGICVTGDQFIDDPDKANQLRNDFSADVAEMEAYAIASTAREFGILNNTVIIKSVSDGADNDANDGLYSNLDFAMNNGIEILKRIMGI